MQTRLFSRPRLFVHHRMFRRINVTHWLTINNTGLDVTSMQCMLLDASRW